MNKLLSTFLLIFITNSIAIGQNRNEDQIRITQEQLMDFPHSIVKSISYPIDWDDNSNVILSKRINNTNTKMLYNVKSKELVPYTKIEKLTQTLPVIEGAKNITFSPNFTKVAYTKDNNLYVKDLASGDVINITNDGSELILNGYASWVYYEEILGRGSRYKAFWWSPDSKKIAFYRFDNTNVPMFPIYDAKGKEGSLSRTRYPKAGAINPEVKIGIADLSTSDINIAWGDFDEKTDQYFGIPFWSSNSETFIVPWMPRVQNNMLIYAIDCRSGKKKEIYSETQPTWINWVEEAVFTEQGMYMVRDFEMWQQIYYLSYDGSKCEKLTSGDNWGINIVKLDQEKGLLFYTAQNEDCTRTDLFMVTLKNKKSERISFGNCSFSSVRISPDSKKYVAIISNVSTPSQLIIANIGKKISYQVIEDSKGEDFEKYKLAKKEIVKITTEDGFVLPASVTYPIDLDSTKKYPVIFNVYGGPDSPGVFDRWSVPTTYNQWWANEGVIVANIDCRTAGHNGKKGMNCAYQNLGEVELTDFVLWAKYFTSLPFVNSDKIGITGFSFGGTMTAMALFCANDYFKYGIAGGGVYDWILYDSHYTERFMNTPQNNPEGYKNSAVINKVKNYQGDSTSMLRITHGTSDDNVHFQNTLQLIDALQKENKIFELMIYPGGFHGYRGYQGAHSRREDMVFWYKYLLNTTPPEILFSK